MNLGDLIRAAQTPPTAGSANDRQSAAFHSRKTLHPLTLDVNALAQVEITGLTADSRTVKPGNLFAALAGATANGTAYIKDAIAAGAVAILYDQAAKLRANPASGVIYLPSDNPRHDLACLAAAYYGRQPETCVAVTGTNGKSSVVTFFRQLVTSLGGTGASLGTLGVTIGDATKPLRHTTPDPIEIHDTLRRLAEQGVTHLALEASSHGLEQHRLDGVRLSVAAYTNLSQDHLDYHQSMEHYFASKARLFDEVLPDDGTAVINLDDSYGRRLLEKCRARNLRVIGIDRALRTGTDLIQVLSHASLQHAEHVMISYAGCTYEFDIPLVGYFQASNALIAAAMAIACGFAPRDVFAAVTQLKPVPGRLEWIGDTDAGARVFVDYAHTPEGLDVVLKSIRPHTERELHVVFGAGGDRDSTKRPLMGQAAADLADKVYVTDDNPRTENPAKIRAAIMAAAPHAIEIGDRQRAIETAIAALRTGDVLVIAGKGHETGQIIGDKRIPFDDRDIARACLHNHQPLDGHQPEDSHQPMRGVS